MIGQAISAQATVTLYNNTERYSPFNSSSPIYSSIRDGQLRNTPIRIEMGYYDGTSKELLRQFTGLIASQPPASITGGTVTWSCLGRDEAIKEIKGRSVVYEDITLTDWVEVLAAVAGVSSADQQLDIDDSELQFMWLDDDFVTMKFQEAAEAAGGLIYFDHSAKLRFEGMQHWVNGGDHTQSQYTYTTSKFTDLQPGYSHQDGYSAVVVEYIRRTKDLTDVVWENEGPLFVGPGETEHVLARLNYPCSAVGDPIEETDYQCITPGGTPKNSDVTITGTVYAAQVELDIVNNNQTYGLFVHNLQLRGRALMGGPKNEVRKTTSAGFISDTKEFPISGNQAIQSEAQAQRLSTFYRDRFERVPCVFTIPSSPAKPWLELGDRVTAVESDHGINHDAYIVGATYEIDTSHYFSMSLRCLEAQYLYPVSTYYTYGFNLENLPTISPTTDNNDMSLGHASRLKIAAYITHALNLTCRAVALNLVRVGTPGGKVRVVIYSDSGGLPGSPITGGTSRWVDTADIDTATTVFPGQWYPFAMPDEPVLSLGVQYHTVLESDNDYTFDDGVDEIVWRSDNIGIGGNCALYSGSWGTNYAYEMPRMEYSLPMFY
jgi:hypothetical protein